MHQPQFRANVDLNTEVRGPRCLQKVEPALRAIPASEIQRVNLDITTLCASAVGAAAKIRTLRDRATRIEEFNPRCIDDLEDCAFALSYIDGQCTSMVKTGDDLAELYLEGVQMRSRFHSDATNLCVNGVVGTNELKAYTGRSGYKPLIDDLRVQRRWNEAQTLRR
jgi:hypothetical protein